MDDIQKKKIRHNNIIWTVAENYHFPLNSERVFDKRDFLSYYYSIIYGAGIKFFDEDIYDSIEKELQKYNDKVLFTSILMLCLDSTVFIDLVAQRPVIKEIGRKTLEKLEQRYFLLGKKRMQDELEFAYFYKKSGKIPKVNSRMNNLLTSIFSFEEVVSVAEFKEKFSLLLSTHFHVVLKDAEIDSYDLQQEKSTDDVMETTKSTKDKKKEIFNEFHEEILAAEFNESSELTQSLKKRDSQIILLANEKNQNFISIKQNQKITSFYGKSIISAYNRQLLEKNFSKGIHRGIHIHITDGHFPEGTADLFRKEQLVNQFEKNFLEFQNNFTIYNRHIMKLKDIFLKTMFNIDQEIYSKSYNGLLQSNIAWKHQYLNQSKIFTKKLQSSDNPFSVDILLDASGSQSERQEYIAVQGYIISQALSLCNIPNRVCGFNNFLDYTVIRRYRDYDDPLEKNKKIFEYFSSGTNRDGFALRIITHSMEQRIEENKVLIILSDGKPNDIKASNHPLRGADTMDYTGMSAVKDTAFEVRLARMKGIAVLGVFTGKDEDLAAEKLIYGKDFAYIHNVNVFSDIVGIFLKRQINNIMENY